MGLKKVTVRVSLSKAHIPSLEEVLIAVPPQNTTVVLGRTTVMECMAQGLPKPFVSWSRMGKLPPTPPHCHLLACHGVNQTGLANAFVVIVVVSIHEGDSRIQPSLNLLD